MEIIARIEVYNNGSYGRRGEYIARVRPNFFKNGKMKKTGFEIIEIIEVTAMGWRAHGAASSERIIEVIDHVD